MGRSEEGNSFRLVGREAQISLIKERLATLWQEDKHVPAPLLLHFHGMRGIGKTDLLRAVEAEMQTNPPGSGLITLFIATSPSNKATNQNEISQFHSLEEIDAFFIEFYRQFQQTTESNTPKYKLTEYEQLLANRPYLKDEEGLWLRAKTLASDLLHLHREAGLRLLLLEDNAPPKVFQWLSKFLYKDLLVEHALCVVATGYAAPVVSTLSLVQYFKSQALPPLKAEEMRLALNPYGFSLALEDQLIELAAGHPASLQEGTNKVVSIRAGKVPELFDSIGALNPAGLAQVAGKMAEALLQDIPATLARCCRLIASLRSFRYDTLAALLPGLMPDDPRYGQAGVVDFMLLGKELNDRIDFIESDKTYVMNPTARAVLANALKYENIALFKKVNNEAANYYTALAERLEKPEQRAEAILEELYHRLLLAYLDIDQEQRSHSQVLSHITGLLQQRLPLLAGPEGIRRLAMLLENDLDFKRRFANEMDGLVHIIYEIKLSVSGSVSKPDANFRITSGLGRERFSGGEARNW